MYNVSGFHSAAGGDDCLTGRQPSLLLDDLLAFFQYRRPAGAVNGSVYPTASHQAGISRVDDCVSILQGNVSLGNGKRCLPDLEGKTL
jgi:sulfur carrier protein ThiS